MPRIVFTAGLTFDPATGEVRRGGEVHRLEPQPAALLALLASRPGELVTHDEIVGHLWPAGTHVAYRDGVHYAIRQIRVACGDHTGAPRLIETLPRRGYRLRAAALVSPAVPVPGGGPTAARRWPRRRWLAGGALVLAIAIGVVEQRPNDHHAQAVALLTALHDWIY